MSLYNALFGTNPFSSVLLSILDIKRDDVPRFRDCFLNEAGDEIIIHTRTGGGNREAYEVGNQFLKQVAGYKFDSDDDFDCTYANFHYEIPEAFREQVAILREHGAISDPAKRWQETLAKLKAGDTNDPTVKRALAIGEKIMAQMNEGKTEIEV